MFWIGLALDHGGVGVIARLWTSALLTFLAHLCMLGAYVVALMGLGLEEPTVETVAALLIVMFVSSLPISLAGWGIRELTAVAALGVIGIEHSTAMAGAIIVGAVSFVLMIVFSAWGSILCLIPGFNCQRDGNLPSLNFTFDERPR